MKESFLKNKTGIILMLFSSLFVCVGQLMWKLAVDRGLLWILAGYLLYGIGALIMLAAYRFGSLSVLQPMLSMNYVISIFLATFILKESADLCKMIGIITIILGVILIGGGDE